MASVHRQKGRPFWFAAFMLPDGRRVFRSTKSTDKKQAWEICRAWVKAAEHGRSGRLTPDVARDVIARGVADVFTASNSESLPSHTVRDWCKSWLESKQIEAKPSTSKRYRGIVARFMASLGAKANKDLVMVRPTDVANFRDTLTKELSRTSANLSLKVLRVCFNAAMRQGLLTSNPANMVDVLKQRGESQRRPFTAAEIRRALKACYDTEWRGLVLFGVYTGQRLGDIARTTWRAVDVETGEIRFTTRKTGRRMVLPLAKPLRDYLLALPSTDNPDAAIFPKASKAGSGTLSRQFHEILVEVGLAEPWTHEATGKGRDTTRQIAELSFHSLRHSATTFLKAAGASEAVAMAIIGHDTAAISRGYTHLSTDDLRDAVDGLPDVTKTDARSPATLKKKVK